jgi:hypothetical protein
MRKKFAKRGIRSLDPYFRAQGELEQAKVPSFSVLIASPARLAIFGFPVFFEMKGPKIGNVFVGHEKDVASLASVATVRTTFRHVLLPKEAQASVATIPCLQVYLCIVVEHLSAFRNSTLPPYGERVNEGSKAARVHRS